MAVDLALYVLADPLHSVLVLATAPGSGFGDEHHVDRENFLSRGRDPQKEERLAAAKARDADMKPLLDDMHRRAVETLTAIPDTLLVRDTNVPVARLPGNKLKAMGLADRALIQAEANDEVGTTLSHIMWEKYANRAFVIDIEAFGFLMAYATKAGTDTAPLRRVLEAGLGRVATILGE